MRNISTRRLALALAAAALPLGVVGCGVPQDRYDNLLTANRSLQEQLAATNGQRNDAVQKLNGLEDQLGRQRTSYANLQTQYNSLSDSVDGLSTANEEYLRRITQLELGPLPGPVRSQIADIALDYPDVLEFDPSIGMLRFSSDFTFDLGSTALRSDAQNTLSRIAGVLSGSGRDLEVRVVGHTDNVPIRKPATREKHPTNLYLSVHRAIAVYDALVQSGVDPVRLQVAGYGPYRPIVANGAGGAAPNRRVEIFLTQMPSLAFDTEYIAAPLGTPEVVVDEVVIPEAIERPMK